MSNERAGALPKWQKREKFLAKFNPERRLTMRPHEPITDTEPKEESEAL
jgi:hypothetical protein